MKLIKILFGIIALLLIANVVQANHAVDESLVVSRLTREIDTLSAENLSLKQVVAKEGAIAQIKPRLEAAGFSESPLVVSLAAPTALAYNK